MLSFKDVLCLEALASKSMISVIVPALLLTTVSQKKKKKGFALKLFYVFCQCVCAYVRDTPHRWSSEGQFLRAGSLFSHVGSKVQTQLFRLGSRHLYILGRLESGMVEHACYPGSWETEAKES